MKFEGCFLILIAMLIFTHLGCKKTETRDCAKLEPVYYQIDQLCYATVFNFPSEDLVLIMINSAEELITIISFQNALYPICSEFSEILKTDFSKYTVLIGQKKVGGMVATIIDQNVTKDCKNNLITYSATIKNGGYQALGVCIFAIRILKQDGPLKIQTNINLIN